MYIMKVDTCSTLLSVSQVSTTGKRLLLVPPELEIPVALLRLPDVPPHVRHPFNGKEGFSDRLFAKTLFFYLLASYFLAWGVFWF